MKLTSDDFGYAIRSWSHIVNKLDKTDLQALSTAIRTAFAKTYVGDKVRYIGDEYDSGFKFGDIVTVTGVFDRSISAVKDGCTVGYFISSGDYIGYLD
jgi:hypothetical protein